MSEFDDYLAECRALVLEEIRDIIPKDPRYGPVLYELMLDYPLREGKGFRPALCMATCRALGGHLEATLRTAAVLELYHNAFLIHDDFEDGSLMRRGDDTLHRKYGAPIAINVGDAMLALSLSPLLDNMELLGLGKALRILRVVADMARESAEGQALELFWIRERRWDLSDEDYFHLVHKKTCWYTFLAPILIGGLIRGVASERMDTLEAFAVELGVAFQIVDDVLNLTAGDGTYGKEHLGDLWEGKHTLILMHAMRTATPTATARAQEILQKERTQKTDAEIEDLYAIVQGTQSIDYARRVAGVIAGRWLPAFLGGCDRWPLVAGLLGERPRLRIDGRGAGQSRRPMAVRFGRALVALTLRAVVGVGCPMRRCRPGQAAWRS